MATGEIVIRLTTGEALVLFEWLARENDADAPTLTFQHEAERVVLWRVEAQLDKALVEPFAENYRELLDDARRSVVDGEP